MKKILAVLLVVVLMVTMVGCGNNLTHDGKVYPQYGVFNMDDKSPDVQYQICIGNVIWSVILCETIIVPIIIVGFYLYEPIGMK